MPLLLGAKQKKNTNTPQQKKSNDNKLVFYDAHKKLKVATEAVVSKVWASSLKDGKGEPILGPSTITLYMG